jgi:hypothetical protein
LLEVKNSGSLVTRKFTVAVLLATFRPDLDYLDQQINSIIGQIGVQVKLFWSDDSGSNYEYAKVKSVMDKYKHFDVTLNLENKGANTNFLYLLDKANHPEIDYYAFSDQDDIWESDKLLKHAIAISQFDSRIACTHSKARIYKNGRQIDGINLCQKHELRTLLAENCFQGCTMMINGPTRKLVLNLSAEGIAWYDWWIGSIVSITGFAVFVEGTDTNYRLHKSNLIGIPKGMVRFKRLISSNKEERLAQSRNLLNFSKTHGYLAAANEIQNWIDGHSGNFSTRLIFVLLDGKRRKRLSEDLIRRIFALWDWNN